MIQTIARQRRAALLAIATGLAIAACGGSDSGGDVIAAPPVGPVPPPVVPPVEPPVVPPEVPPVVPPEVPPVVPPDVPPVVPPEVPPVVPPPVAGGPAWLGFGSDAQHTGVAQVATQELARIRWQTPLDMAPQYTPQGYLRIHYGSPVITAKNTVLLPVKRAVEAVYRIEARSGRDGSIVWRADSDYVMPAHTTTPSYNVTLTRSNRMYAPGAGGKVLYRDDADAANSVMQSKVFYGDATYTASKAALDASVFINTPITADAEGNIYFGFIALADNPAGLKGGFARIGADGAARWASAATLTADSLIGKAAMNSAPALSNDQKTLYVAASGANEKGYLLALDAATLQLKGRVLLIDPQTRVPARVPDNSTASPTVGPDGDVYFGVRETTFNQHNARGWMMHFDASLATEKTPGSFGWDITASIVPAAMVPSYSGSSKYLITTKYNDYARSGNGDSKNKVAVLDPNATQPDKVAPGVPVMKEVLTVLGVTPDPAFPGGVYEWCINTAAVDPFTKSILVNNADGWLYRWDLTSNTLSEKVRLNSGQVESYTPSAVGADGTVYAVNNAVLFAIGK